MSIQAADTFTLTSALDKLWENNAMIINKFTQDLYAQFARQAFLHGVVEVLEKPKLTVEERDGHYVYSLTALCHVDRNRPQQP